MTRFEGKTVVVTGAGGLLGSEYAKAFATEGARVALLDRDIDRASDIADEINSTAEARGRAYEVELASADSIRETGSKIIEELGPPDILVNNAATKSDNFFDPFETFPTDDWEYVMATNVTGVMLGCQVFGSIMVERGKGSIINILSIYGIVAPDQRIYEGSEYLGRAINTPAVYSTSKAALLGLTRYLASYWGEKGVRVNAVTPGGVFSGQNDEFVRRYSYKTMLGRMAHPKELCGAITYLASDDASYVTGHNLVVDAGLTAW